MNHQPVARHSKAELVLLSPPLTTKCAKRKREWTVPPQDVGQYSRLFMTFQPMDFGGELSSVNVGL